jgi:hypothetical protein
MLRLVFTYNTETLIFDINNKQIIYRDRKWPDGVSFIPKDEGFMKKVLLSRNRISNNMIEWIVQANEGKSLAEWQACVDDAAVAEVCKRDARLKGCIFRKSFTDEELAAAEIAKEQGLASGYIDKIPIEHKDEVK